MYTLLAAFFISQLTAPSPEAPFREPQLAAAPGLTAIAFGSGSSIYVATAEGHDLNFAKSVKVAGAPSLLLSHHRGPRIVISGNALVVTAVVGQTPADGDILAWRSLDRGRTWSKPIRLNDAPASAREALHTLAADGNGNLFAAWLDHRDKGMRLYGAWSSDSGATWNKNVEVYASDSGTICPCCDPTARFDPNGGLDVMFRNVVDGSRDLYLLHADAARHFGSAQKLGMGTWKIDACPMDGGAITHSRGKVLTAWRRMENIFLSEPHQPEKQIGQGKDVTLAASGEKVYAAWVQNGGLVLWNSGNEQIIDGPAAFPNLTALPGGGALLAWEGKDGISLRRLP